VILFLIEHRQPEEEQALIDIKLLGKMVLIYVIATKQEVNAFVSLNF